MKIAVLLSGGVDSSVALKLLKDQGHDVTAFYLKIWLEDELSYLGECPWQQDLDYAQKVCQKVGVPLKVVSLQKEYHDQVVSYTIAEIKAGRTPNPDILCNSRIKFGLFIDKYGADFDKVASGHYAQIMHEEGRNIIMRAPDPIKDQSYFLSHLSQEQLGKALFPIGQFCKAEIRQMAQEFDLPTKDRKDSQGICFLGKFKFKDFVKHHLGTQKGSMIEIETGEHMGTHEGFWFYTIGQRQGLGLAGGPWYVAEKDCDNNIVYISRNYYSADKKRNAFTIENCNWFSPLENHPRDLQVKLRHGAAQHACTITPQSDGSVCITLQDRDQGIAPGQFAVLYDGNVCLGGGVITK